MVYVHSSCDFDSTSLIPLQGKHNVVKAFIVTKLGKKNKKNPLQPLLLIAKVLMDVPYN